MKTSKYNSETYERSAVTREQRGFHNPKGGWRYHKFHLKAVGSPVCQPHGRSGFSLGSQTLQSQIMISTCALQAAGVSVYLTKIVPPDGTQNNSVPINRIFAFDSHPTDMGLLSR